MSSSRVQTSLIGMPAAFDTSTASSTKSVSPRRPKPPPTNVVTTVTASSGRPAIFAAIFCESVCACVGVQSVTPSARTSAVVFIGSIGACARYGVS